MAKRISDEVAMRIAGKVFLAEVERMIKERPTQEVVRDSPELNRLAEENGIDELTEQDKNEIATWIDLASIDLNVVFI